MSAISKEGYEQLQVIKNALDSMFEKLEASGQFANVQDEFDLDAYKSWSMYDEVVNAI